MFRLTRRYHFSASHRLHSSFLTEEQNRELYGKCNNPYGHGHNYVVEISVAGPIDEQTGMMVDQNRQDNLVNEKIVSSFHYRNLNVQAPEFKTTVPTTENLAVVIEQRLKQNWRETFPEGVPQLAAVRIYETERNIITLPAGKEQ